MSSTNSKNLKQACAKLNFTEHQIKAALMLCRARNYNKRLINFIETAALEKLRHLKTIKPPRWENGPK